MSQTKVTDALRNVTAVDGTKIDAVDGAKITTGTIPEARITSLDATKLTGNIASARIPAAAVTQHVTGYNDASIRADILKLALHQAIDGNRVAYSLEDSFIDGFEDDTGITTETTVDRDATGEYVNTSGAGSAVYETGDRQSTITVTDSGIIKDADGVPSNLVNGSSTTNGSSHACTTFSQATSGQYILFTFSTAKIISECRWIQQNGHSGGVWKWQGSNDNSTYTDIGTSFTLGNSQPSQLHTELNGNTTAYTYYRLFGVSGTAQATDWIREVEFKVAPLTVVATGTLISDPQTASTSRTSASGVIIYEDALGTSVLGTDLKIYFSCDNSTWTEASSYGTATTYSGTKKLVKLGSTNVVSGTAIAMKAVWANQSRIAAITGKTISTNGSPTHSTSQVKVGTTSMDLSGSNGFSIGDHADWTPSGDWTVEMWLYSASTPAWSGIVNQQDGGNRGWTIGMNSGEVKCAINGSYGDLNVSYSNSTWFHIAYVRDGSTIRLYKDGVQTSSKALSGTFPDCATPLTIGTSNGGWTGNYNGYIDELRISHVCRYPNGTTFTSFGQDGGTISSPTPFTRDSDTKLLIQSNTTNGSTTFVDTPTPESGKEARLHGWAVNY